MKKNLLFSLILLAGISQAQVGINTTAPASTLDITAKSTTGNSTNIDGILIPRVDRQRAQSMNGTPVSTLIYINNVSTGTQTDTAINIDTVGFYYYDGTAWVKMHNPNNSTFVSTNIYNADGSLTGNRMVTQNANTLSFIGSAVNSFSVNGSTLSVDGANNRLGVGTATPLAKFHVNGGETRFSSNTSAWGLFPSTGGTTGASNSLEIIDRINNMRRMIFSDNGDVSLGGTILSNSAAGIISIRTGNTGINTGAPQKKLHVNAAADAVRFENLSSTTTSSDVLAIDASGDIRRIPFNNLLASSFGFVNTPGANYTATANENMIWVATTSATVTLPVPTSAQLGKDITIVASGASAVTIAGQTPVVTNGVNLTSIPQGKRITVYGLPAGTFGNASNTWVVAQKDF